MGKLNIAHHKSYHPYRLDNVERVRRDEEEARQKEEHEEGRIMLADSEARIQLLRERAGVGVGSSSKSSKARRKEEEAEERKLLAKAVAPRGKNEETSGAQSNTNAAVGHINFFEDLEQNTINSAIQRSREAEKLARGKGKTPTEETEKGIALAPSVKDRNPWYSARRVDPDGEWDEEKRKKVQSSKSLSDPLTSINHQLGTRFPQPSPTSTSSRPYPPRPHLPTSSTSTSTSSRPPSNPPDPLLQARLTRESSERQRAIDLIAKKKRDMALFGGLSVSATPTTVHGSAGYYGDQFNRKEVEEAHERRGKPWSGGWGKDKGRERERDARDRRW